MNEVLTLLESKGIYRSPMPRHNQNRLSLFLLVLALVFTACGDEPGSSQSDEAPAPAAEVSGATQQETATAQQEENAYPLGTPRNDLDRFYGVYGDPDNPGRDFFVAPARRNPDAREQIPEGYLMIGAMWGDVAPWYMQSRSDTRFEQQWVNPHSEAIVAAFELGEDDAAVALTFNTVFAERGRLERLRDLPEKWH